MIIDWENCPVEIWADTLEDSGIDTSILRLASMSGFVVDHWEQPYHILNERYGFGFPYYRACWIFSITWIECGSGDGHYFMFEET